METITNDPLVSYRLYSLRNCFFSIVIDITPSPFLPISFEINLIQFSIKFDITCPILVLSAFIK
jgi:hypothetical protein